MNNDKKEWYDSDPNKDIGIWFNQLNKPKYLNDDTGFNFNVDIKKVKGTKDDLNLTYSDSLRLLSDLGMCDNPPPIIDEDQL